jgi:hypothetical protein
VWWAPELMKKTPPPSSKGETGVVGIHEPHCVQG